MGLTNNAGITRTAMIEKMPVDAWQEDIDVHASSYVTGQHLYANGGMTIGS
ncbi:hypothetical protein [Achromobacter sp. UMC46]|uniref:hypothetical protein n=1 Tax=Achromobacter sp. UMC46 TaxID=1862319 RepID=UPI001601D246|nr:hypothetical protein [Achromobacter sp. UMC46]